MNRKYCQIIEFCKNYESGHANDLAKVAMINSKFLIAFFDKILHRLRIAPDMDPSILDAPGA
jgi:hypothetical protein